MKLLRRTRRWFIAAIVPFAVGVVGRTERITMADLRRAIDGGEAELKFRFGPSVWEFVRISPGEFLMGSAADDTDREEGEMPAQHVRITRPFYLAKYQVTQAQYESIMHNNPSEFYGDDLAIDQLTYTNALEFCRRMSSIAGVPVTLPTEAQGGICLCGHHDELLWK